MLNSSQNQENVEVFKNGFPLLMGWLFFWLYVIIGILLLGFDDFNYGPILYPWELLFNLYFFFPFGQIIIVGLVFIVGTYIGRIFRLFFPNLASIKGNPIFYTFLITTLILVAIWSFARNNMPYYTGYTEAQCSEIEKGLFTSKYINAEVCFHDVAKETKNYLICNNLNTGEQTHGTYTKGFCLEEVAHLTKDPATCELIPLTERFANSDRCLSFIGVCERVKDSLEKKRCNEGRAWSEAHPNGY
jgi:hypothetical protein